VPSPQTIRRWRENVRTKGIANNGEKGRHKSGRPKTVRKEETVERVRKALIVSPARSGRKHAASLRIKRTTWRRIVKEDLNMHPYKIQITQQLNDDDYPQRFLFCEKMLMMVTLDNFDVGCIWFSDEAHFDLFGNVNKQNFRYYSESQPGQTVSKPLHSPRVTVWCAISGTGIIGPFFFEDAGANVTVNSQRYLDMLKTFFIPELRRNRVSMNSAYFQQDGATSHTTNEVLEFLKKHFKDRIISRRSDFCWPARSPDLTPLDFFLWGHLKAKVYARKPRSIEELKIFIREEVRNVNRDMLQSVSNNFVKRIRECIENGGKHLPSVIFKKRLKND